jgi:UDP-glucose 4-epimerase
MKKYMVTGSTGLIGSHLIRVLGEENEIYAISRNSFTAKEEEEGNIKPILLDLSSFWIPEQLPDIPIDAIIHLAQSEHFRDFPNSALSIFEVNTFSTLKLLDYACRIGAKTFIYASSGGIYRTGSHLCSEETEISLKNDLGFYINTKLCSEMLLESYSNHLTIIILRFFFVYGPGQQKNMLIPRLVQSVMDGRPVTLQGENGLRMNPTHVSDAVHSVCSALSLQENHVINIGGPNIMSLRDIAEEIGNHLDKKPVFDVNPAVEPGDLIADIHKMSRLLGEPKTSFEAGIQDYLKHIAVPVLV